jgi:hypothetical protein
MLGNTAGEVTQPLSAQTASVGSVRVSTLTACNTASAHRLLITGADAGTRPGLELRIEDQPPCVAKRNNHGESLCSIDGMGGRHRAASPSTGPPRAVGKKRRSQFDESRDTSRAVLGAVWRDRQMPVGRGIVKVAGLLVGLVAVRAQLVR